MTTGLGQLGNLPHLKQLDQMRPRYIEEICRFLSSQCIVVLDNSHLFAREE